MKKAFEAYWPPIAVGLSIWLASTNALSQPAAPQTSTGCPLKFSILEVDEYVEKRTGDYARATTLILDSMRIISEKATKPGIALGDQLSRDDIKKFNELRQKLASISSEKNMISNYKRDAEVIVETYKTAKLADLYGVKKEALAAEDPRNFYFTILEMLRLAEPSPARRPLRKSDINCDVEAGLYFEEEFNQQQLAKYGANQRIVNLIFDIQRLRTLHELCRNLLDKGIADVRSTTWSGDTPISRSSIQPYIQTAGTTIQSLYKFAIPYIDQHPSEGAYEQAFQLQTKQQAERDYPVKK